MLPISHTATSSACIGVNRIPSLFQADIACSDKFMRNGIVQLSNQFACFYAAE